ncbi:MAG: hypothetical protein AUJ47_02995 [Candidatus Marinimicrobia bacterium CG1_02_48_14]|nr:MAG: hypothetical protein AUJ47_02995 [Candidatus Marinimicrobia bacterium CG1_02_48_14]
MLTKLWFRWIEGVIKMNNFPQTSVQNQILEMINEQVIPFEPEVVAREMLGQYYESIKSGDQPFILFCAGASGRILQPFFEKLHLPIVGFCDNNIALHGHKFCGLPVFSVDTLKQKYGQSVILIASAGYHRFIKQQLLDEGFAPSRILTLDAGDTSIVANLKRERLLMLARNGEPQDMIATYKREGDMIERVFHLLKDNKSKNLYIDRLVMIASCYEYTTYRRFVENYSEPVLKYGFENTERLRQGGVHFYFRNDVLALADDEVFLDGGAYNGDSAESFIQACEEQGRSYNAIHCFEADKGNYAKLKDWAKTQLNIACHPLGLWNEKTQVRFASSNISESYGARIQGSSEQEGIADIVIDTVTIDEVFSNQRVSLIKMDIEGAEIAALEGARHVIRRDHPKLAISVYHNPEDLYRIPAMLAEMNPDYRFYLRHLGNHYDDTILFAIDGD